MIVTTLKRGNAAETLQRDQVDVNTYEQMPYQTRMHALPAHWLYSSSSARSYLEQTDIFGCTTPAAEQNGTLERENNHEKSANPALGSQEARKDLDILQQALMTDYLKKFRKYFRKCGIQTLAQG